MPCLEIIEISAGSSIQDLGRIGFQRYGVTSGGAMDRFALAEGQALLGNDSNAAALELTLRGGSFRAAGSIAIATSGAEMGISVNNIARRWRSTILLKHGDNLEIQSARQGVYGYLHLLGGIDSPLVLGSRSYYPIAGIGSVLARGHRLCAISGGFPGFTRSLSPHEYLGNRIIRTVPSAQSGLFPEKIRHEFERSEFEVLPARNRQGIQLSATAGPFFFENGLRVASAAISRGDIQITGDGTPIILMADSQPTGGFPRIACVISADLGAVAQIPVGEKLKFRMIEREEAVSELKRMNRTIRSLRRMAEETESAGGDALELLRHSLISGAIRGDEHEID